MTRGCRCRFVAGAGTAVLLLLTLAGTGAAGGGAPVIRSVSPATVAPGGLLTLGGANFGQEQQGSEVAFVGGGVTAPAAFGTVVSWTPTTIEVKAPSTDLWPGADAVEVITPAWDAPSGRRPVTVVAPGGAITAAAAAWRPDAAASQPATQAGGISVGWYDAAGIGTGPITLTLPTATPAGQAAFSLPATLPAGAVTLDGAAADAQVGSGTVTWPDGGTSNAATLSVAWPAGVGRGAGPVTVAVAPSAGITAAPGLYPLGIRSGGGTALASLQVSADGVAAYQVTVPASVPAGSPFPVDVQAVDAGGRAVAAGGTVYLSSIDGSVDFRGAAQALDGPTTAAAQLHNGAAEVIAVASVAGPATVGVRDMAGLAGTAALSVQAPAAGSGLRLQIFPAFSGYSGPTEVAAAAGVDTLARHSGVLLPPTATSPPAYGGWWPDDPGQAYEAQWSGVLTVRAPAALPAPLPQPVLQFAFLNVAAGTGTASLVPLAGTGAQVNGGTLGTGLATAVDGSGWLPPTVVTLTPGQYRLTVRTAEDLPQTGSGDTLYYAEAYRAPSAAASIFAPASGLQWSPLVPVPPAAFTPSGLPDGALVVPIGSAQADDAGAPVALPLPAQIASSRTLLPLRAVAEMLGAQVAWDPATRGITVTGAKTTATLTVGSAAATVNGQAVTLDQPALLLPPGVTMVPLRFLGQALGWQVAWDGTARNAVLLPALTASVPLRP